MLYLREKAKKRLEHHPFSPRDKETVQTESAEDQYPSQRNKKKGICLLLLHRLGKGDKALE